MTGTWYLLATSFSVRPAAEWYSPITAATHSLVIRYSMPAVPRSGRPEVS